MFFKGDRVLYRNTHFGTVHEVQTGGSVSLSEPTAETVAVKFDKPYVGNGKPVTVRTDDLEKVRDAEHERYLSLQINRFAPSKSDWKPTGEVMDDDTAHKIVREMRDDVVASVVTMKTRLRQEQEEFDRDPAPDTAAIIRKLEQRIEDAVRQGTALAIACSKF